MKKIIEELLYESESESLDFKSEQYKFVGCDDFLKAELLKDILAFANAWRRTDAYVLIGIKENKGGRAEVVGVEEHIDDAQLQQFVNQKTQRPIIFSYHPLKLEGKNIAAIKIGPQDRPIYLKKDFTKLNKNTVYIRRGSSTDIASLDEISKMGSPSGEPYSKEPKLVFGFADLNKRQIIGSNLEIHTAILNIENESAIPNYGNLRTGENSFFALDTQDFTKNKDYHREMAKYIKKNSFLDQAGFYICNEGNVFATDVNIELRIKNEGNILTICEKDQLPSKPSTDGFLFRNNLSEIINKSSSKTEIKRTGTDYLLQLFIEKVQPKQTIFYEDMVFFGSTVTTCVPIDYTIFCDNLSEPLTGTLSLSINTENKSIYYQELLGLN